MMHRTVLFFLFVANLFAGAWLRAGEVVFEDFEGPWYGAWEVEGTAFGEAPARGTLPGQQRVSGFLGGGLANSYLDGDKPVGAIRSPGFKVSHGYISFLLGGGNHPGKAGIELLLEGRPVRSATGADSENLDWRVWDVRDLIGKEASLRVFDRATGGWGHVNVDQIVFSDGPRSGAVDLRGYRGSPGYYRERHRPRYHFTPEINWMNDPNGLVYFGGEYHLFYQYNPFGNTWGHMSWGHAVSRDLVHWEHLPVALYEEDGTMIFSGSAVVDWKNTSGFGTGGAPPLVAIYTGHREGNQSQCLAYSNDRGRSWTKYAGNPVLDIGEREFRDPKVFWHEGTRRWVMVVAMAAAKQIRFYGSADLKRWELLSEFGPAGAPDKPNWECPDLFELPIEGRAGETRWVLETDLGHNAAAGGSGGEYFIGRFDGERFTCEDPLDEVRWVDYGRDFYAPVSWSDVPGGDGRRIWIGWMNGWGSRQLPTSPWRSAMSIPRVLSLRETDGGLRLVQKPVRELQSLRGEGHTARDIRLADEEPWRCPGFAGETLEIIAEFEPGEADTVGLIVRIGGDQATVVGYDARNQRLFVDRRLSGRDDFDEAFPGIHGGPLKPREGWVRMHLFVDASSVEVFGNDGETVITSRILPDAASTGCVAFAYSAGGDAVLRSLEWWPLGSIWHGEANDR